MDEFLTLNGISELQLYSAFYYEVLHTRYFIFVFLFLPIDNDNIGLSGWGILSDCHIYLIRLFVLFAKGEHLMLHDWRFDIGFPLCWQLFIEFHILFYLQFNEFILFIKKSLFFRGSTFTFCGKQNQNCCPILIWYIFYNGIFSYLFSIIIQSNIIHTIYYSSCAKALYVKCI